MGRPLECRGSFVEDRARRRARVCRELPVPFREPRARCRPAPPWPMTVGFERVRWEASRDSCRGVVRGRPCVAPALLCSLLTVTCQDRAARYVRDGPPASPDSKPRMVRPRTRTAAPRASAPDCTAANCSLVSERVLHDTLSREILSHFWRYVGLLLEHRRTNFVL